ncbi:NAD(P)H-dependent oxidoreductase subunit E [Nannocystis sp. SCPEA4]|uniref:NAD(P)H-dependent oxidoreductase subunit E n=1 Tax=Nannocystis sp. SCPEA4 TaxID=2996787 RepID=UPI00226F9AB9|nr:NAD(P)H-dependent oxidoreductase subunit E [Nannocystis sp. SCPEA4]MCY1055701.1 NAD(P)H-dependent oxidoreductase subunit E [Nannocystis sp. SCPEA4]
MRYRPPSIIQHLNALQAEHGWLRHDDLVALARELGVPLHRIEGVASFYPHYRRTPPAAHRLDVCRDLACAMRGGADNLAQLRAGAAAHEAATGERVEVCEVSCLGRCDQAPAVLVGHDPHSGAPAALAALRRPHPHDDHLEVAARSYRVDPYARPGERYATVRALAAGGAPTAEALLAELKEAGLRGMGGAGFPTALKWRTVRDAAGDEKFVVCNADESEPGTFKDRELLASLPHLVWEGMMLGAVVVGARRAIVYLRHEYELERRALAREQEVAARIAAELDVELEIFVSPGGYIMGEETALLEALEDRRGEPRNKPPYPGIAGLFGQPTLINNVETLTMATAIAARGAAWWKAQGVRGCAGLKFVSVSGDVVRPGVHEVATGTTIAELVALAGGVPDGAAVQAVMPGGASTAFLAADKLETPLDFEHLRRAGSSLGSGAVVVVAEGRDMLELGANVTRFFRNESCGKCVPCRVGTEKAVVLLDEWLAGHAPEDTPELLRQLDRTLGQTSICGLGQVALLPVVSILDRLPPTRPLRRS